ncbi:MAG TPA: phosphoglucosamine mutase [bacterium]|nr:phosphoglucosamine mutase [bacterium]
MKKLFGTDGIRGVANQEPMTSETALALGRALAVFFRNGGKHHRVLIGKDTRRSCYMLENALASGLCSMGAEALLIGPMPTPGVAFLIQAMRADAGVVISASHNSFEDNGLKVFDRNGFKLPDADELKIESMMASGELERNRPTGDAVGRATRIDDASGRYIEFVKSTFPKGRTLDGLKVVVDCAHGAAYKIAPTVLAELGAETAVLGAAPDGLNINDGVGAVHPQAMAAEVRRTGACLGIALDGDADRVIFADENGRIVDGDAILALCAENLIKKKALKDGVVVATVMSNKALEDYLVPLGGKLERVPVGDRYVVEKMREGGYGFGGEASGHMIFRDHATTGDGLVGALQVLSILEATGKRLSELVARYHPLPQVLTSVKVPKRQDLDLFPDVQKLMKRIEHDLGAKGRLLVRYSGTEPLIRIMIEGHEDAAIRKMAGELTSCIQKNLS